ncbi:hypothetical protein NPIL_616781 [Nephila pilipes]|uniref:Uncharacterized protein n=1 Tax=Nephila pilipes TaxID=299642 RepID=A0A8X6P7P7_NEPPI|nr:hypothetical protein NPIL_616781 [Nephila pilipes]
MGLELQLRMGFPSMSGVCRWFLHFCLSDLHFAGMVGVGHSLSCVRFLKWFYCVIILSFVGHPSVLLVLRWEERRWYRLFTLHTYYVLNLVFSISLPFPLGQIFSWALVLVFSPGFHFSMVSSGVVSVSTRWWALLPRGTSVIFFSSLFLCHVFFGVSAGVISA